MLDKETYLLMVFQSLSHHRVKNGIFEASFQIILPEEHLHFSNSFVSLAVFPSRVRIHNFSHLCITHSTGFLLSL